ncbi:glycosyltransferase [Photobacterium leiognathi]|uniref:glycosyltransferase n=1 Tax=Photobacterium leiognathi TaxID=553611 RepID=UPI0027343493|nr:glycosyltransferase [Photobacterium leiognathi]
MKKIIVLCDCLPYPYDNGIKIPLFHFLESLSEGFDVKIISITNEIDSGRCHDYYVNKGYDFKVYKPKVLNIIQKIFCMLLSKYPQYVLRISDNNLSLIKSEVAKFRTDVAYVDMPSLSGMLNILHDELSINHLIYAPNDSLALGFKNEISQKVGIKKIKSILDFIRARKIERNNVEKASISFFVSENDKKYVNNSLFNGIRSDISVIENGVDIDYFCPQIKMNKLLFVGTLEGGNRRYLQDFIKDVYSQIPINMRWEFVIVGGCNDKDFISYLQSVVGINYVGRVTELNNFYGEAFCVVSPIRKDAGIINKVLEGLSSGCVVIGYEESFDALKKYSNFGKPYITVSSSSEFVIKLTDIFNNYEKYEGLGLEARKFATATLSWQSRYISFREIVNEA